MSTRTFRSAIELRTAIANAEFVLSRQTADERDGPNYYRYGESGRTQDLRQEVRALEAQLRRDFPADVAREEAAERAKHAEAYEINRQRREAYWRDRLAQERDALSKFESDGKPYGNLRRELIVMAIANAEQNLRVYERQALERAA